MSFELLGATHLIYDVINGTRAAKSAALIKSSVDSLDTKIDALIKLVTIDALKAQYALPRASLSSAIASLTTNTANIAAHTTSDGSDLFKVVFTPSFQTIQTYGALFHNAQVGTPDQAGMIPVARQLLNQGTLFSNRVGVSLKQQFSLYARWQSTLAQQLQTGYNLDVPPTLNALQAQNQLDAISANIAEQFSMMPYPLPAENYVRGVPPRCPGDAARRKAAEDNDLGAGAGDGTRRGLKSHGLQVYPAVCGTVRTSRMSCGSSSTISTRSIPILVVLRELVLLDGNVFCGHRIRPRPGRW